ncbi:hypothetical protein NUU61_005991 [Penicillium alfredii]|uniref:Mis18 domain-containing protein n=1 Tax=Penicillium alfredii TaxID=1506179 RepID=A0A9W9F055_9EURO|nr:uncharacterized protein NUU61_005991 [Penicillium alfredii]KAJ5091121.1 hypothetical protein NUU61_005991 [Penicillium alfredii]
MELSHLTRPAILGQCVRCSSSLAALENEWARLSNSYSVATGWLSVELHRISVSSERKQIPQTSDMSPLRGRIVQELVCKLCHQKLGVLCPLDNGSNILWKMSKVAFREIVTMRTVEPLFKEGALDRLLCPPPKEPSRRDRTSFTNGALVPSDPTDLVSLDPYMQQQMLHQGRNIDQISSSVNHLQDTMTDLKQSFTALRIELNSPSRAFENGPIAGHNFDMIATVLKELKSKSEEIEKLKLEIEALKLKNRIMGDNKPQKPGSFLASDDFLPEVRSPGLLQAGRKRAWPDAFFNEYTEPIPDSIDDTEDMLDDLALADTPNQPLGLPTQDSQKAQDQPDYDFPQLQIEPSRRSGAKSAPKESPLKANSHQSMTKRPRLTHPNDGPSQTESTGEKRRAGRPRKSSTRSTKPTNAQTPETAPSATQQEIPESHTEERVPISDPVPSAQSNRRRRPSRRSTRSQSRGPSRADGPTETGGMEQTAQDPMQMTADGEHDSHNTEHNESGSRNEGSVNGANSNSHAEMNEKRKAKVAARDTMTRLAMQREEAMETEQAR